MPVITIDNEVYDALGARVLHPFTDTPNLVLRRILGLDQHPAPASQTASESDDKRTATTGQRAATEQATSSPEPPGLQRASGTTAADLLDWLDRARDSGRLSSRTADSLDLLCRRVLAPTIAWQHLDIMDLDLRAVAETFAESTPRPASATIELCVRALTAAIDAFLDCRTAPEADRHHHASTVAPDDQAARRTDGGRARPPPRSDTTSPSQHPANHPNPLTERPTAMTTNTDSPTSQIPKLRPAIPPTQQTQGRPDSCLNFNLPDGRGVYMQVPYGASPDDIAYVMDVISGQLNALARRAAPTG